MLGKIGSTLIVAGIFIGLACGDPTGPHDNDAPLTQPTKRDTNPNEPNLQKPVFVVHISANVENDYAPYTVSIHARNLAHREQVEDIGPVTVPSGPWKTTLDYNGGERVEIEVEVKPSRPGSQRGFCLVVDGLKRSEKFISGGWRAYCTLTTTR